MERQLSAHASSVASGSPCASEIGNRFAIDMENVLRERRDAVLTGVGSALRAPFD
jgi:hypothetical protein